MLCLYSGLCSWPRWYYGRRTFCPVGRAAPWATARPRSVRPASCCLLPRQISGRRAACPPARRPRRELRSARRLEARPGPAGLAAASNRSGVSVCCLARLAVASLISHVIHHQLIQILNLNHWNYNDSGTSRKMTTINYVRNLAGGGVVADHGCAARRRPRAPQSVLASRIPPMHATPRVPSPCGAWCAVMASPVSASHAVHRSPCSASSWRQR